MLTSSINFTCSLNRDMLKICPKLPGQKFKEPPLEDEILSFIRDLGYHCAQILWGMYYNKKKKADSESSPKTKPTQASKGKRIKTSAKGDKPATKSKGLTVLSEVALSEADQIKLATKISKKEFHSSHASGLGDGVDIQSKVPDEQQTNSYLSGTMKRSLVTNQRLPNDVPEYRSESEENLGHSVNERMMKKMMSMTVKMTMTSWWGIVQMTMMMRCMIKRMSSDQKVSTPPDYEITNEGENQEDDDNVVGGEKEDEEDEELYGDLNLNLDKRDVEMTDA
ncbi:hypothetical protein Tco_1121683 [Tanacetum coccineum]|uniref:Uncharacterized protein n=1 Tax=Tanacetum coccineum TaxID=301880 RepID=A0ABQ5J1C1_9ASTR